MPRLLDDLEGGHHVIPLSGGLDSRALLAAGLRDRIVTVTMGSPGMLDYEIGRRVARAAGVAHETIDLTSVELDAAALESVVAESGASSWVFDLLFHRLIPRHFGRGPTYWSGFMGAELAGSHMPDNALTSWSDAVADFVAHNRFCGFAGLARPGFDHRGVSPGGAAVRSRRPVLRRPARLRDPAGALHPAHRNRRRLSLQDSVPAPELGGFHPRRAGRDAS